MQKVVTAASEDSPYVARKSGLSIFPTRAQSNGVLGWTPHEPHQLSNEIGKKTWDFSTSGGPPLLSSHSLFAVQESPDMPTHQNPGETNGSAADSNRSSDRNMSASTNGSCWRLKKPGPLVDPRVTLEWELAQDIARLNLGSVGDLADDLHIHSRTPPQSKLAAGVQYSEASPLETASEASIDSSPHHSDHQISPSHSRVSSTDTLDSHESAMSSASHTLRGPPPLKISTGNETKERPHSFSGGLSTADLRRLKLAGEESAGAVQAGSNNLPAHQWTSSHYRDLLGTADKAFSPEQPTYPSLSNASALGRGQQRYDYNGGLQTANQRGFFPTPATAQHFGSTDGAPTYRGPQRGFPQPLLPNPTSIGYPAGHVPHLSLGTAQQLYDMVVPHPDHPAVTRVQQQHNMFRGTHQHSASDPASLRDAATLALLNNQAFNPAHGLYPAALGQPAIGFHTGQFYPPDNYAPDVGVVVNRLQPQFTGTYGSVSNHSVGHPNDTSPILGSQTTGGPSANNRKLGLYKTELCRSWEEKGTCRYGTKCQFAHGEDELRTVPRHPKYKTEICRTFWVSGACPYGKRCCFIHTELPVSGIAPGADGAPPPASTTVNRERSNSDPNEASNSLLARIQRKAEATPVDVSSSSASFFNTRPPTGSLRVDTTALSTVTKQNKSAYPTFTSNALMLSHPDQSTIKSPVPLTAGPDFGRHNTTRLDIVGLNQRLAKTSAAANPVTRHSFHGTDVDLDFTSPTTPSAPAPSSFVMSQGERVAVGAGVSRAHHVRSGSAGNWGRNRNLAAAYSPPSEGVDGSNAPWSTSELPVGSSRLSGSWM